MNKERTSVLILEGEITDAQIAKIPKDFQGDIVVNGDIICDERCEILGSLWLNGNVDVAYLKVNGDLFGEEGINIVTAHGVDVSGDVVLKNCYINVTDINVGGDFEGSRYINSTCINVYGKFKFDGRIDLNSYEIHAGKLELDAEIENCSRIKTGW